VAGSGASNGASTTQSGPAGAGGGAAPEQTAETGQQAAATATASQDAAGNLVVVVRINSPGDDGPISQTNAAIGSANAANTSATTQGQPTPVGEPAAAAGSGEAAKPRRPTRKPAQDPARKRPAAARTSVPASAPPAAPVVRHQSSPAPAADRAQVKHPAIARAQHKAKPGAGSSVDRRSAAGPLHRVAASAAGLFHSVAPPAPVAKPESADVSQPVFVSLLVALAALMAFVIWPQRPDWLRLVHSRTRLRG
jgi:hypothetical protein